MILCLKLQDTWGCWPRITNIKNTSLSWIPYHQTLSVSTLKLSHVSRLVAGPEKQVERGKTGQGKVYHQDCYSEPVNSDEKWSPNSPQHSLIITWELTPLLSFRQSEINTIQLRKILTSTSLFSNLLSEALLVLLSRCERESMSVNGSKGENRIVCQIIWLNCLIRAAHM